MQKTKVITWISSVIAALAFLVSPVGAFTPTIQTLPSHTSSNNFKISCTASGANAQFMYKKEGGSYSNLGASIDLTNSQCLVQVTSNEINDQTKYYFKVTVDGNESAEVSTTYDSSGPGPVSGYYKEKLGDAFYKLHWKNPGDSDFSKVIIYRGETSDFSADNTHEIARVSGGANAEMTYDEHQPDASKTYYYLIRAIDYANNSSGLVGDGGTSTTTTSQTTSGSVLGSATNTKVSTLPKEGSILGEETTSPAEASNEPKETSDESLLAETNTTGNLSKWVSENKTLAILIALGLGFLAYTLYKLQKKK